MIDMVLWLVAHIILSTSGLLVRMSGCLVWLLVNIMVIVVVGMNRVASDLAAIIVAGWLITLPVLLIMDLGMVAVIMVLGPTLLNYSSSVIGATGSGPGNVVLGHRLLVVVLVLHRLILTGIDRINPGVCSPCHLMVIASIL